MTEWRQIPSLSNYLASDEGEIRHVASAKSRTPFANKVGYRFVGLWHNKKLANRTVHSLIAEAFIGSRPDGQQVRHIDGDPANNRASNLCYGTALENAADRERHGMTCRGQRNGNARASDQDIDFIRIAHAAKLFNQYQLAAMFHISQAQVSNIVLNRQRTRAA